MAYSRTEVVKLARSWRGFNEADGSHKKIIDIYNSYKPLPRGIPMQYNWAWCACTWSALAIKLGYTSIMPIEISCGDLIERAKTKGCWVENDGYVPKLGDAVLYDWQDSGKGDNTGWPDHVGTVDYVNQESGYFTVIEGNYSNAVKTRTVSINGKFIRGFIAPKYDDANVTEIVENPEGKDLKTIAHEVIIGQWGSGEDRKKLLSAFGYDYAEVQKKVNDILNTPKNEPVSGAPANVVECTCKAASSNPIYAGSYSTSADLYLRNDAGTNKKALVVMPAGTIVQCYGYYTKFNGKDWFLVTTTVDGVKYTGFCHSGYLRER